MTQNESIDLGKRQLVDSIWKSAGIEGLGTTFPSTKAIIENLPVNTYRDEVFFVCNMKKAWEFLFNNIDYPTNLMFLRELNKICLDNLIYKSGEIRTSPVTIGGTSWVPGLPNSSEIIDNLVKINENPNKLDTALDMFCYIARTQMFIDGNKRVAQLICNKIMMENDLGIFSVPHDEINNFTNLLIDYYETNDKQKIKEFFIEKCLLLTEKGKNELLLLEKDDYNYE